jgi:hypothetical protein
MNTSTNTNQIHEITTSSAVIGLLWRSMVGVLLAVGIAATALGLAAASHADDAAPDVPSPALGNANCKTEGWGFLGSQRRTLCDGPIQGDGSWSRERTFWVPAHEVSSLCTSYGGSSSTFMRYSTCSGGYFVPQHVVSSEIYPVRPDSVLSDEPGHLDN